MKRLTYTIWNKDTQKLEDCLKHDIYVRCDGKVGYITTVGEFVEYDELVVNSVEIK